MGESRAALGAGLGGFQREPEPTLPEKPSELLRLFLWGDKGWGSGSLRTTPPGVTFAGHTGPIQSGTSALSVWPRPPFSFQSPVRAARPKADQRGNSRSRTRGNPGHGAGCQEWREGKPRCPAYHPSPQKARPHTLGPPGNAGTAGQGRCCVWEVPCGGPNPRGLGKWAPSGARPPPASNPERLPLAPGWHVVPALALPVPTSPNLRLPLRFCST